MAFRPGRQVGFLAQEVEEVLPEIVRTGANGYKTVAYGKVVPLLVEAMKQQQKQIEQAGGQFFFDLGDPDDDDFERKFKDPNGIIFDLNWKGWTMTSSKVKPKPSGKIKQKPAGKAKRKVKTRLAAAKAKGARKTARRKAAIRKGKSK